MTSSKVTLKSDSSGTATVSWTKNSKNAGVEVYRSVDNDNYYKVAKIATTNKYTNKNLTSGKTYYYKVRAYNYKKDGTRRYAKYSSAKSVKVK